MNAGSDNYDQKKARLAASVQSSGKGDVRLNKTTSNLFRNRKDAKGPRLDVMSQPGMGFESTFRLDLGGTLPKAFRRRATPTT